MADKKNKFREPFYKTPEELEAKIQEYFDSLKRDGDEDDEVPNIAGLADFLGYASKQSIYDNEKHDEDRSYLIKRARLKIESFHEKNLGNQKSAVGSIFWLKNHSDYKDKQEIDSTVQVNGGFKFVEPDGNRTTKET